MSFHHRPLHLSSWILLLWSIESSLFHTHALASRSKRKAKPNKSSGGGFGAVPLPKKSIPISYLPDTSPITKNLESFLLAKECEGVGAEGGTEIGHNSKTGMRGLFAADTFEAGEFLLGVPFPCCLALSMDDIALGEPSDAELGLRLHQLLEQGSNSNFKPYYQSLPTREENFDGSPDFWASDQLKALEFPPIVEKTKERQRFIRELALAENVDEKQLQFATWLVKSRGFTLLKPVLKEPEDDSDDKEPEGIIVSKTVMMPYVDMINHSPQFNAELVVLETKAEDESFYAVQATSRIAKGEQITLCYGTGQETTLDLLSTYGFIPKGDNPNDVGYLKDWKDIIEWSTTLEDDEAALKLLKDDEADDDMMKQILEFRIQMKRALLAIG